ncbi:MAG: 30S ribosomal protein S20 [Candidatus Omnitrophica bacterium]|nr:30S ribosomal protein S20 [Candidatus Omnitrophota bacterium]
MRADRKLHQRNVQVRSELKTLVKQFEASLTARQAPQAQEALRKLTQRLDIAGQKGILPKNTVSRKIARLSRRLSRIAAAR